MNNNEIKKTEKLLERFFDGDTTLAEERRLYGMFRRKALPPELEKYRPLFAGFDSMQADNGHRARLMPVFRRAMCGTAVALALIFGMSAYLNYHEESMLARVYGGSYVIENGHRIDDLSMIKTDIETALGEARHIEEHIEKRSPIEQAEQDLLNSIDNPDERKRISEMLN